MHIKNYCKMQVMIDFTICFPKDDAISWLTIEQLIKLEKVVAIYKVLCNEMPLYEGTATLVVRNQKQGTS